MADQLDEPLQAPTKAMKPVSAQKLPPPETRAAKWQRRSVLLSFWGVIILLGLPVWWKTTMIYRASLPLDVMNDWADGKVCKPVFPLRIALDAPSLAPQDAMNLVRATQDTIDNLNDFSAHQLRVLLAHDSSQGKGNTAFQPAETGLLTAPDDKDIALTIKLNPSNTDSTPTSALQHYAQILEVDYPPNHILSTSSASSPLATFIAKELQAIFAEEQNSLAYLLSTSSVAHSSPNKVLSPEVTTALARQSTRSFKYAPTYHLTFSLFTPSYTPSSWDIEAALENYITPLLGSLSSISNFTVDTQVQLYASFSPSIHPPEFDEERKSWTLRKEDLSGFINAAEWPLSPSIGKGPTVNFILYVPTQEQSPLMVRESGGHSWLVPQWGGVHILNAFNSQTDHHISRDALGPAMLTFSNQLLSLLGLPASPSSLPLRVSTLMRIRSASLLFSASSTLGALARLTRALPSIEIPDNVAISVDQTIHHLQQTCNELSQGRFHAALNHARIADAEAEKAFFDPAMVGQVYFPDEHKVAVYLPLLGPIAVPLILAAIKEIKRLKD